MKKLAVVLGTARKGNYSSKIALMIINLLKKQNINPDFVDVKDFLLKKTTDISDNGEALKPWVNTVASVDGLIFVCPEYNHSYPGELKILIDSLYEEYKGKVAGMVTVSKGQYGGVRLEEKLRELLITVNLKVAKSSINISYVQDNIDEEKIKKHLDKLLNNMKQIIC